MTLPKGNYTINEISAFKVYYDSHYDSIRNFIYFKAGNIDLAEDIVQETFLSLWDMREKIKPETVKALLYTIAKNHIFNHFRHKKIVYNFAISQKQEETYSEAADFQIQHEEFKLKLETVLANLSEKCRILFLMNRIENLTYSEIAERLKLSIKAIEKRMHEALLIVREQIKYKI